MQLEEVNFESFGWSDRTLERIRRFSEELVEDILRQRAAERALAQSELRYRLVALATRDIVYDWTLATDEVEWNDGVSSVFGYSRNEVGNTIQWWREHVHPEDRDAAEQSLEEATHSEHCFWSCAYRFLRHDGDYANVEDRGYIVRDRAGRALRMVGAMTDVTERHRGEEERRILYEQAQEAIRARDEFLSVASHELRTPLTTLQLHVQHLRMLYDGEVHPLAHERTQEKLDSAQRQVRRLATMIDQLLDVSRINAGRLALELEPVDLGALAREVVARLQEQGERAGGKLSLEAEEDVVGRWDALRLDQVITNLVTNALKYGRSRPVRVKVSKRDRDRAVLEVQDEGIGIAPTQLERIFNRFERAASDRAYGGFGLGLWIVQRIVAALKGEISVRSELGVGSTFTVVLPR